jgi:uncharacterized surface protein with fasciclin (FAS1) repeats
VHQISLHNVVLLCRKPLPAFPRPRESSAPRRAVRSSDPELFILKDLLIKGNLIAALSGAGPFTVFAPTDAAFAALPAGTVEGLLQDIPTLTSILTYHVVSGAVDAATVVELPSATTLNGADVTIRVEGGNVFVNDAQVIITDIMVANGIVHVIDGVLLPPAAR